MNFAGGAWDSSSTKDNYLYGIHSWFMSPNNDSGSPDYWVWTFWSTNIGDSPVDDVENSVHAVINLKSDVTVTGSGTEEDPYVVQ